MARRMWTGPEVAALRYLAEEEGLSMARASHAMLELYGYRRARGSIAGAALQYNIKFTADSGAPYGNQNAKRAHHTSIETKRAQHRERQKRYKARKKLGLVPANTVLVRLLGRSILIARPTPAQSRATALEVLQND